MKNAVIYARFSSHAQNEQSIEGQLAECRAFAERNNLRIVREYIDRALTGTTDKRPDFLQMIEDSKRKGFQFVIVYQLDRFARNRFESMMIKHQLKEKCGVKVLSALEPVKANRPTKSTSAKLLIILCLWSMSMTMKL